MCAILSDLGMTACLYLFWCTYTCSERSRYSETSLATERFFLVVTPYGRMNHAIPRIIPVIHGNMYDVLRCPSHTPCRRIPVRFYLDMSVPVAELLVGSNNMFPNTISLDLLPRTAIVSNI